MPRNIREKRKSQRGSRSHEIFVFVCLLVCLFVCCPAAWTSPLSSTSARLQMKRKDVVENSWESESERQGPKQELTLSSNQVFFLLHPGLLWLRSFFFSQSSFFGHGPEEIFIKQRKCEIWPVLLSQHWPCLKFARPGVLNNSNGFDSQFSASAQDLASVKQMHCNAWRVIEQLLANSWDLWFWFEGKSWISKDT